MEFKNILYEVQENIGVLTINRPKAMNALNGETWVEIAQALSAAENDKNVKALIITGAGRAFIAGADITEFLDLTPESSYGYTGKIHENLFKIENFPKPVIAGINGVAFGAGTELALACHIKIASEKALFGLPEAGLGAIPGGGGTQRLPRAIGKSAALYYMFTGENIKAEDALRLGMVNKVVAPNDVMRYCFAIAKVIATKAPIAIKLIIQAVNKGLEVDMEKAIKIEQDCAADGMRSEDFKEGAKAFMEKRAPVFKGK